MRRRYGNISPEMAQPTDEAEGPETRQPSHYDHHEELLEQGISAEMEGMENNISPTGEIPSTDSTESDREAINEIVHDAVQEVVRAERQQTNRQASPYQASHETDWAEKNQTIRQADWAQRHKAARKAKKQQQSMRWQEHNEDNEETNEESNVTEAIETDSTRDEEDHQDNPQPKSSQSKSKKVTTI